jgi:hypothetical protein
LTTVEPPTASKKWPPFRASPAVLVLGFLIAIPGVVVVGSGLWQAVFAPTHPVPGVVALHLGAGTAG